MPRRQKQKEQKQKETKKQNSLDPEQELRKVAEELGYTVTHIELNDESKKKSREKHIRDLKRCNKRHKQLVKDMCFGYGISKKNIEQMCLWNNHIAFEIDTTNPNSLKKKKHIQLELQTCQKSIDNGHHKSHGFVSFPVKSTTLSDIQLKIEELMGKNEGESNNHYQLQYHTLKTFRVFNSEENSWYWRHREYNGVFLDKSIGIKTYLKNGDIVVLMG